MQEAGLLTGGRQEQLPGAEKATVRGWYRVFSLACLIHIGAEISDIPTANRNRVNSSPRKI